jgi:hypothetical protein
MTNLVTGVIGIAALLVFLGILGWWIKEAPLIIIFVGVGVLLIYDFVQTLRFGSNSANR